jgi:hypothetical protein
VVERMSSAVRLGLRPGEAPRQTRGPFTGYRCCPLLRDQSNRVRDIHVQELIRRVRWPHAQRGECPPQNKRLPESRSNPCSTCTDGLIGQHDRVLRKFDWASGGRRRPEVTRAVMEEIIVLDSNNYLYRLVHSKTDQARAASHVDKPIAGVAVVSWHSIREVFGRAGSAAPVRRSICQSASCGL